MRFYLAILLSTIMLAGCQGMSSSSYYRIDEKATAQAPWKPGEIIAEKFVVTLGSEEYRKFIGVTDKGYYVVQDFYAGTDQKATDPIAAMYLRTALDLELLLNTSSRRPAGYDGAVIAWNKTGQKIFEYHYQDGKAQGLWAEWYKNGQKEYEGHYQDGKEQGRWTWWYANGQKEYEGHYQDGKMQGLWTWWYKNGQKWYEGHCQNSKEQGLWTWWHENGHKWYEGHYQDGKKQGLWTAWRENGTKISETQYEAGEVVRETIF